MYQLTASTEFLKKSKRFIKNSPQKKQKLNKILNFLQKDPFHPGLKTHRVQHKLIGKAFSSWITGDKRLIWDFVSGSLQTILLIDLGGHSGKDKVYS